jgi:hypothetical protein
MSAQIDPIKWRALNFISEVIMLVNLFFSGGIITATFYPQVG